MTLKYLQFSNIKTSQDWNPVVWSFQYHYQGPTYIDPKLHIWYIRILFLSIMIVIDDGSYRLPEQNIDEHFEEEINTHRGKGGPYD